ncbi:MAG: 50S ribosomal protein L32 [Patescibacteria group bacterium]
MAVPKQKKSKARTRAGRSHLAAKPVAAVKTATGLRLSHRVDPDTGKYRGRQVVKPKD